MNIHFTDRQLFENLKAATIAKVKVGSHLYGTNTEKSDEDFLYIYATSKAELNSFITTHHQLQFKENNTDHNFVSFHTFLRNCINGDSPINFEVIQSRELVGTIIEFLHKYRKFFITYTVIRSYNGLVQRDIKQFNRAITDYAKYKKYGHIIRGIAYVESMLENKFDFLLLDHNLFNTEFISEQFDLNPIILNYELEQLLKTATDQRKRLNDKLNEGSLKYAKILDATIAMELHRETLRLTNSILWHEKQILLDGFDMSYFINAHEHWVSY